MPKSVQPKDIELDDIVTDIKKKVETLTIEKPEFPSELEDISDVEETDDTDDILAKYKHDSDEESKQLLYYQNISSKMSNFINNSNPLKFSEKQKRALHIIINKLFEKTVVYSANISFNNLHEIYQDKDQKFKDLLLKIRRFLEKVSDLTLELKNKHKFTKAELKLLFNSSTKLFNYLVEIVELGHDSN